LYGEWYARDDAVPKHKLDEYDVEESLTQYKQRYKRIISLEFNIGRIAIRAWLKAQLINCL